MNDERLRELVRLSHDADAPPGFAATLRAARARETAPRRRHLPILAAAAGATAAALLVVWALGRDRVRDPAPPLAVPALEVPGPFDELPSPFPGLAVADLIEDPW